MKTITLATGLALTSTSATTAVKLRDTPLLPYRSATVEVEVSGATGTTTMLIEGSEKSGFRAGAVDVDTDGVSVGFGEGGGREAGAVGSLLEAVDGEASPGPALGLGGGWLFDGLPGESRERSRYNVIAFGIESYYVQEGTGLDYEAAVRRGRVSAVVAVAPDGQAALRGLRIER